MFCRMQAPWLALVLGGLWACQEPVVPVLFNPLVVKMADEPQLRTEPVCPERVPDLFGAGSRTKGRLVVVFKHDYLLGFYRDGLLVQVVEGQPACFPVAMGDNPYQAKMVEDRQSTPEGWYRVGGKLPLGISRYHQALSVSYPNGEDAERAWAAGIINARTRDQIKRAERQPQMPPQHTAMGGEIMIHGNGSLPRDWTWGCVALDNQNIDWLYAQVKSGDEILFLPWNITLVGGQP